MCIRITNDRNLPRDVSVQRNCREPGHRPVEALGQDGKTRFDISSHLLAGTGTDMKTRLHSNENLIKKMTKQYTIGLLRKLELK